MGEGNLFDSANVSGVLTDREIEESISTGHLIIDSTYNRKCLEASSYDVRVGNKALLGGEGKVNDISNGSIELPPGSYAAVISKEKFSLPKSVCARIGSKRGVSYDGIILLTGSLIDPGFIGHLLFGLYNASQKKVVISEGRKIASIIFERLSDSPDRQASHDSDLLNGDFSDDFITKMANMDVLPWSQISTKVKEIEKITSDIFDLKKRYEDVLEPIRNLAQTVKSLSDDISSLSNETKTISKDVARVNDSVDKNSSAIGQLTTNMGSLIGKTDSLQGRISNYESVNHEQSTNITEIKADFGKMKIISNIVYGLIIVVFSVVLTLVLTGFFTNNTP